jgi:hypothetical protein
MQKPLVLGGIGEYTFQRKNGSSITYPSLLTSRWSVPERDDVQFIVNYLPERQTCHLTIDSGTAVTVHHSPDGQSGECIKTAGIVELTINPLDAVMLAFETKE